MKNFFGTFIILLSTLASFASHVPGGNLTYECIGNDQYLVTLTIYEDRATGFIIAGGTEDITITNDCGFTNPLLTLQNHQNSPNDVSQLCPTAGSGYPQNDEWIYTGIVTLSDECDSWGFSYTNCCRDASTNLNGTSNDYYFEATLNNDDAFCNSSPTFSAPPIPYVCAGQTFCYNLGVVELDGDSLAYSFAAPLMGAGTSVPYNTGFSFNPPIAGLTIDPITGQVTGFLSTQGSYVIAILVEEFDEDGNLLGTVTQDFTVEVLNCANQVLDCASSGIIDSLQGSVTVTGPTSLEMCELEEFSFIIGFIDPDGNDSLSIVTNLTSVLNGATITELYPAGSTTDDDSVAYRISWTPPIGSANSNNAFSVTVSDNACPVSGQQTIVYYINVLGVTTAFSDTIICNNQTAYLYGTADGTSNFTWTPVPGGDTDLSHMSCTNCQYVSVNPNITTQYELTTVGGVCASNTADTITVEVVTDYDYNFVLDDSTLCFNESSPLTITVSPNTAGYSINWEEPTNVTGDATVHPTTPGDQYLYYSVTSPEGCVEADSLHVLMANDIIVNPLTIGESCIDNDDGSVILYSSSALPIANYSVSTNPVTTSSDSTFHNLAPGNYTATVTDNLGCQGTQTFTITSGYQLNIGNNVTSPTCSYINDGIINLSPLNGTGPYTYTVNNGTTSTVSSLTNLAAGTYTLISEDFRGCLDYDTIIIVSNSPVVADFNLTPNGGLEPLTVYTSSTSTNETNENWFIDDALVSTDSILQTFDAGTYQITLVAYNNGCSDTTSQTLIVNALSTLIIPNIFTPNGDGVNDEFSMSIGTQNLTEFSCTIFNRWGKQVADFTDPDFGWDGDNNKEGTYYYVIKATGDDGATYEKQGHFALRK